MIGRNSFLFSMSPVALGVIATVGFSTALFAAVIGFAQNDIKKVLAYSTVSQLGYMFGAMGVAAYTAGIFHLVTHAFFKACLFLGSGSVIHAMSGEQDIRKMGGLKDYIPITYRTFFIATIAIAGIFPFAGFFSKDEILWHAFNTLPHFWVVGLITAGCTAIYMFRLVTLTFYGETRMDEETKHHIHESPVSMTIPLIILAFLSIVGGFLNFPETMGHLFHLEGISEGLGRWLEPVLVMPANQHELYPPIAEFGLGFVALAVAVAGCYLGYLMYSSRKDIPETVVRKFPNLYRIVSNKFYVDEFYQRVFVRGLLRLNDLASLFDAKVIDRIVNLSASFTKFGAYLSAWFDRTFVDGLVNLTGETTALGGALFRKMQSGRIQTYLYYALGAVLLVMMYRFL
jgi:NADH-quinone oxidoreductase subunit L